MSQASPASWRSAMMTPPIASIGAEIIRVADTCTSICTCCTSFVLRVISDGAPNCPTSRCENATTRWKRSPRSVAAHAHRQARPEVHGDDGADHLDETDPEHDHAGLQDVVDVARDHAVVDDVRVQRGQHERGDGLCELEDDDGEDERPRGGQVANQELAEHGDPFLRAATSAPRRPRTSFRRYALRASGSKFAGSADSETPEGSSDLGRGVLRRAGRARRSRRGQSASGVHADAAAAFARTCSGLVAPAMTLEIAGRASSQPNVASSIVMPRSSQNAW